MPMAAMAWSREPRKKAALLSALALCRCVVAESSLVVHDIQSGVGAMLNGACFGLSNLHGWYFGSDFSPNQCACNRRLQRCPPRGCTLAGRSVFDFTSLPFSDLGWTLLVVLTSSDFLRLELATMGDPEPSPGSPASLEHRTGLYLLLGPEVAQGDAAASSVMTAGQQDKPFGPLVTGVS